MISRPLWFFISLALIYVATLLMGIELGGAKAILTVGFLLMAFYLGYVAITQEKEQPSENKRGYQAIARAVKSTRKESLYRLEPRARVRNIKGERARSTAEMEAAHNRIREMARDDVSKRTGRSKRRRRR